MSSSLITNQSPDACSGKDDISQTHRSQASYLENRFENLNRQNPALAAIHY
jgi:hypothetical protein